MAEGRITGEMESAKERIYRGKSVTPDQDLLFRMLRCPDGPEGERIRSTVSRLCPIICRAIKPSALFTLDRMPEGSLNPMLVEGCEIISVIMTLGPQVSKVIDQLFEQDAFHGFVADLIANACMFAFEEQVMEPLKEYLDKHEIGVCGRFAAPTDFELTRQRVLFERSKAEELLYVHMNEGQMFIPEKSTMIVYVVTKQRDLFETEHDCRRCGAVNCDMRKVKT